MTVRGAVRILGQPGLVWCERERGGRRDVYVVDDGAWHQAVSQRDQLWAR